VVIAKRKARESELRFTVREELTVKPAKHTKKTKRSRKNSSYINLLNFFLAHLQLWLLGLKRRLQGVGRFANGHKSA
jgi:hypothetical protein